MTTNREVIENQIKELQAKLEKLKSEPKHYSGVYFWVQPRQDKPTPRAVLWARVPKQRHVMQVPLSDIDTLNNAAARLDEILQDFAQSMTETED